MKWIIIGLFLICTEAIHAQSFLYGKLTNYETKESIEGVAIKNTTQQRMSYSNVDGSYTIVVNVGDTIEFSRIGYFKYRFVASNTAKTEKNIELRKQIKILKEARVVGLTEYQRDSIDRAELYKDQVGFEKEGSIMSPVSYVYQRFSKKYKNLEKFQETFKATEEQKFIDTKYNTKIVKEVTGLEGDAAAQFMNRYPMDIDFARTASELEIKMWIKHNYKTISTK